MVSANFGAGSRLSVYLCAVIFASCFLTVPLACGDILNPSFEIYDPNGGPGFPTAISWEHENYAADANSLVPLIETQDVGHGSFSEWLIDPVTGLSPKDGERLLMLSTGHLSPADEILSSRAWQEITSRNGDRLSGYYFFGTCDYNEGGTDYDDFATISMIGHSKPNIVIFHKHVSDIGNYSSMAGWERFEYRFDSATAGTYDLSFMVGDVRDAMVNSYLGIDDLQYCPSPTSYGDFNYDCQSDNSDFAIFSQYWLYDCEAGSESPSLEECGSWQGLGSPGDVNEDDAVDITDLLLIISSWLTGEHP